jgi:hypothetical protein
MIGGAALPVAISFAEAFVPLDWKQHETANLSATLLSVPGSAHRRAHAMGVKRGKRPSYFLRTIQPNPVR